MDEMVSKNGGIYMQFLPKEKYMGIMATFSLSSPYHFTLLCTGHGTRAASTNVGSRDDVP
jgi:hypothetical protein